MRERAVCWSPNWFGGGGNDAAGIVVNPCLAVRTTDGVVVSRSFIVIGTEAGHKLIHGFKILIHRIELLNEGLLLAESSLHPSVDRFGGLLTEVVLHLDPSLAEFNALPNVNQDFLSLVGLTPGGDKSLKQNYAPHHVVASGPRDGFNAGFHLLMVVRAGEPRFSAGGTGGNDGWPSGVGNASQIGAVLC